MQEATQTKDVHAMVKKLFNRLKDRHKLKKLAAGCKQVYWLVGYRVTQLYHMRLRVREEREMLKVLKGKHGRGCPRQVTGECDEKQGRGRPRQRIIVRVGMLLKCAGKQHRRRTSTPWLKSSSTA